MEAFTWAAVVIGIGSSLVASVLFLLCLLLLRPNLHICDWISQTTREGNTFYCIKVVNRSWRDAINIRAELVFVRPDPVKGGLARRIARIPFLKDSLFTLCKYRAGDTDVSYAYRFASVHNLEVDWEQLENEWRSKQSADPTLKPYVQFVVSAQDSVSNIERVFAKKFESKYKDLIKGDFGLGRSCEVVYQHEAPTTKPKLALQGARDEAPCP